MKSAATTPLAVEARRLRILCVTTDWLSTSVAWLIFDIVRFGLVGTGHSSLGHFLLSPTVMAGQLLFPTAMLAVYWLSGYYNEPLRRSRLSELGMTLGSAFIGTIAVLLLMLLNDLTPALADDYLLLGTLFGLLIVVAYIPREVITTIVRRRFRSGRYASRSYAVGSDGNLYEARKAAEEGRVDCYVVRPASGERLEELMPAIAALLSTNLPIYLAPTDESLAALDYGRAASEGLGRRRASEVDDEPLIDLSRTDLPASTLNIKRLSDILGAGLALVAMSPLILALAAAVKLTSPGPAFYRQERVGYHRRPFSIIKLRTMRADAEPEGIPQLTDADDPRVTPLGRIMRRYRLDELPQFVNVIRGEMSLVGPRPERSYFVDRIVERAPFYTLVHRLRPGITSWGMVKYGYASNVDEMVERSRYDLFYLRNAGFAVDMKIILYTIRTIVSGKGL